jgi:Fe-S cluster assembly protein SufD
MSTVAAPLELLRGAYERLSARAEFAPGAPVADWRARAFESFAARGLPTVREEAWRSTSLTALARSPWRDAPAGAEQVPPALLERLGFGAAFAGAEAVFVNGRWAESLSDVSALDGRGVRVRSLRAALTAEGPSLGARLGSVAGVPDANPLVALNSALFEDGALVEIAAGATLDRLLHLLFISIPGAGDGPAVAHPRVLVLAGRGSQATLIETYGGAQDGCAFSNAVSEIVLEPGAVLDHYKLQRESRASFHVATLAVQQQRDSQFRDHSLCLGSALARNDIDVRLEGEGAVCDLDGLFFGAGRQHLDTHIRVDHLRPHGTSRQLYKGVLDEQARGVFHGLVLVQKDAQKTDAGQVNKNLLLSREALVDSTPQLEIRADDVKCKHGSTTGQLDPQALFYLRSRGLGEAEARGLLTYAFASEIVQRVAVEPIRTRLTEYLYERLPQTPHQERA